MMFAGAGIFLAMLFNEFVNLVFVSGFFKVHNRMIHLLKRTPGLLTAGYEKY
jgi:hypothetical protein